MPALPSWHVCMHGPCQSGLTNKADGDDDDPHHHHVDQGVTAGARVRREPRVGRKGRAGREKG